MEELIATSLDQEKRRARKLAVDREPVDLVATMRVFGDDHTMPDRVSRRGSRARSETGLPRGTTRGPGCSTPALRRCPDNPIQNAIEASPAGGEDQAIVARSPEGVRIGVKNGGPPLPAEVRATPFPPFGTFGRRVAPLGLYGARIVVETMGGPLRYEASEVGTAFKLSFLASGTATS